MQALIKFLSNYPLFENERELIVYVESFFKNEFQLEKCIAMSVYDKITPIDIHKCRSLVGKVDLFKIVSLTKLNDFFALCKDIKSESYFEIKLNLSKNTNAEFYYYFMNLGVKHNQFYFVILPTKIKVPEDICEAVYQFMIAQSKIICKMEEIYKLSELIHIDDVTGLFNQRKLNKDLILLTEKYQKEKDPFSVLFVDIDFFKKVNDTYGHLVGTKLLEQVACDIKGLLRDTDISYRYGGDEFVIILTNTDGQIGKMVAERVLRAIKGRSYEVIDKDQKVQMNLSVSIGVAEFPDDAGDAKEILQIADRMMYEAKGSGRGMVLSTQDIFKIKQIAKNGSENR